MSMKKVIAIAAMALLMFSVLALAACGNNGSGNTNTAGNDLANSKYVGTWKVDKMTLGSESEDFDDNWTIVLKEDGTGESIDEEGNHAIKWSLTKDGFKTDGDGKLTFTDDGDNIKTKILGVNIIFVKDTGEQQPANVENPWHDATSAAEAADKALVGTFELPANGTPSAEGAPIDFGQFRYTKMLAEADGYIGAAILTVRKGVNKPALEVSYDTQDVSGDYNAYQYSWTEKIGDWDVKCFGYKEGAASKAIWLSDNFSYSIVAQAQGDGSETYGLSKENLEILVKAIA